MRHVPAILTKVAPGTNAQSKYKWVVKQTKTHFGMKKNTARYCRQWLQRYVNETLTDAKGRGRKGWKAVIPTERLNKMLCLIRKGKKFGTRYRPYRANLKDCKLAQATCTRYGCTRRALRTVLMRMRPSLKVQRNKMKTYISADTRVKRKLCASGRLSDRALHEIDFSFMGDEASLDLAEELQMCAGKGLVDGDSPLAQQVLVDHRSPKSSQRSMYKFKYFAMVNPTVGTRKPEWLSGTAGRKSVYKVCGVLKYLSCLLSRACSSVVIHSGLSRSCSLTMYLHTPCSSISSHTASAPFCCACWSPSN